METIFDTLEHQEMDPRIIFGRKGINCIAKDRKRVFQKGRPGRQDMRERRESFSCAKDDFSF